MGSRVDGAFGDLRREERYLFSSYFVVSDLDWLESQGTKTEKDRRRSE